MVQAWSFAGKYKKRSSSLGPGPGQYTSRNENSNKMKSPQWTIGTSQRAGLHGKGIGPGPGMYKTSNDVNSGPKYHFGSKSITDLDKFKKMCPGPGQYNPTSNAYTFTGRNDTKKNDDKPGPGAYGSKSMLSHELGRFGTQPKNTSLVSKLVLANPGPGQYGYEKGDNMKKSAPKYGFGSANRNSDSGSKAKGMMPGPGQYPYLARMGNDAPKYSLTSRKADTSPGMGKHSPGPGNYNPSDNSARKQAPN